MASGEDRSAWRQHLSLPWVGTILGALSVLLAAIALLVGDGLLSKDNRPSAEQATHYFMYGTMKPGHLRYPSIDQFVASTTDDSVEGILYDTGAGYPAANFRDGGEDIHGHVLRILPDKVSEAAGTIAELEGNLFRPVTVRTKSGITAIAYEYIGPTDGMTRISDGFWNGDEA